MTIAHELLSQVSSEVWATFVAADLHVDPSGAGRALDGEGVLSEVLISGTWTGSVRMRCQASTAQWAAAQMLQVPVETLDFAETSDAMGELVNMVGGNLKSALPAPSQLALPTTTTAPSGAFIDLVACAAVGCAGACSAASSVVLACGDDWFELSVREHCGPVTG